ncbi:MAG TPA: SRPBCC family protein [Acidimicrobiales bacterium]|nr:SRPBCC family protein [Acidimicrobiales bacterium]
MASLRYERRIAAPADVVWGVVTRPETIPEWFPGVVSCTVEGNIRVIQLSSGLEMPEEILVNDALQRRFVYRITAPLYRFHLASIDVIEIGENDSLCVYATTAEPDTLALIVGGGTNSALSEIQRIAESRVSA